jgi:hypothetical protein
MTVEDLFRDLSLGELSNLSMGVEGEGTIEEKHQPKIIRQANEGTTSSLLPIYIEGERRSH